MADPTKTFSTLDENISLNDTDSFLNTVSRTGTPVDKEAPWSLIKSTLLAIYNALYAPIAKGVTNGDSHDHAGGDGAAIVEAAITLADNTTNDASTSKHGFLKKLSNVSTEFMNGQGNWAAPAGGSGGGDGWTAGTGTWSYVSADAPIFVMSVPDADAALMNVGARILAPQTTNKYFIVQAIGSPSDGYTPLTIHGGTDYTLVSAAITSPKWSNVWAPAGFPMSRTKWSHDLIASTSNYDRASTTQNQWYNEASLSVPVGCWKSWLRANAQLLDGGTYSINVALSTTNNGASDADLLCQFTGTGQYAMAPFTVEKDLVMASKTTLYLNQMNSSGTQGIRIAGAAVKTIVRITSTYI